MYTQFRIKHEVLNELEFINRIAGSKEYLRRYEDEFALTTL